MNYDYVFIIPFYYPGYLDEIIFAEKICEKLIENGRSTCILIERLLSDKPPNYHKTIFTVDLHKEIEILKRSIPIDSALAEVHDKYGLYSIRNFYLTETIYKQHFKDFYSVTNDYESDDLLIKTIYTIGVIDQFLQKNNVKYFVHLNFGGEIVRRAAYCVGNKNGVKSLYFKILPIKDHFAINSNEDDIIENLVIKKYEDLSQEEIDRAYQYLEKFLDNKQMISYPFTHGDNIFKRVKRKYKLDKQLGTSRTEMFCDYVLNIKHALKRPIVASKYKQLWQSPNPSEKYVFFPLHYHKESILTIRNQQFWKQEWIVEYCARVLPDNYKLYVKPHPHWPYSFPYESLKQISQISNVRLINPSSNSHDLIKKSSAVIVIASSTGFESILYQKPVVCLGKVYYRGYGLTIDVDNLWNLPNAIQMALGTSLPEKDTIRFIAGFQSCYRGKNMFTFGPRNEKLFLDDDNISCCVDAILDYTDKI